MKKIAWIEGGEIAPLNYSLLHIEGVLGDPFLGKAGAAAQHPKDLFYYSGETDLFILGAHYLSSVALAHAFPDGNKRTAVLSCVSFLAKNNLMVMENMEKLPAIAVGSATHALPLADIAGILRILNQDLKSCLGKS